MLGLCAVNMLWLQVLYAQRLYTSFSQVAERALGFTPSGLAVRARQGGTRAEVAVLSQSPPGLHLFGIENQGTITLLSSTPLAGERDGLLESDAGSSAEYFSLTADGTAVSLLKENGSVYTETLIAAPVKSQRIALADIDGDGRKDILLFGKNRAGVSTFLGKPGGGFAPGPELFGDVSISDLRTIDINGDGIPDVLLCDWLGNRLALFYGISRMVFSEQVTAELPGEPAAVACTWLDRHRMLGVAVAIPAERKILFLRATPSGDIQVDATMQVAGHMKGLEFAAINDDPFPDIVAPAEEGTIVTSGAGAYQFNPPTLLGPGAAPAGWAVADIDGDGHTDFAVAERTSKRLVLMANAQHSVKTAWPSTYAAGSRPRGILARDLDGDGLVDIAVANSNSSTVSILLNRGGGRFSGPSMAFVSDGPVHLTGTVPRAGVPTTLVTSHTSTDRVDIVTFEGSPLHASSTAIPAGSQPFVLHAWIDSVSFKMLLRYTRQENNGVSLSLFEQISGGQFLERSIRFSLTDRIA
ncbi:MAG TPA: VCBS repeat-containing protein, partial [Bacteroidota bacterium]|nr:VCBS repeat-containing protein [Bacteroidota bacterium]